MYGRGLPVFSRPSLAPQQRGPAIDTLTPVADDALRDSCFKQLTETLRALASEPSDQLALFPDSVTKADDLAARFDDSLRAVDEDYASELSRDQAEALERLNDRFATMSRDGAEFDADLWTDEAIRTSVHWREVRELAAAALAALDLPLVDR